MRSLISLTLLLLLVGLGYLLLLEDDPILPPAPPPPAEPVDRTILQPEDERIGARIPAATPPATGSLAPAASVEANGLVAAEGGLVAIHCPAPGETDRRLWAPPDAAGGRVEGGWLYALVPATAGFFALDALEVHWRANRLGEAVACWTQPLRPQNAPEGSVDPEDAELRPRGPGGKVVRNVGAAWKELSVDRVEADLGSRRMAVQRVLDGGGLDGDVRAVLRTEREALSKGP